MLSTDLERGGLPLRLVALALRLRGLGIEPFVGCLAPRGPLNRILEHRGIETFSCEAASRFNIRCLLRFAMQVRRYNPHVIHASLLHANLAARLVKLLDRTLPVITSTVTIEIERRWHLWAESLTNRSSDLHVANSMAVAEHLIQDLGFPASRVRVIPNGLDLSAIDAVGPIDRAAIGLPSDRPLILWAGRMDPVKNLDLFVEAITRLASRMQISCALIGDGPERSRIETLVRKRNIEDSVRLMGWSDNVIGWLKAADLLLCTSRTEGAPNVVLEAMASRCPVVASNIPACAELLQGGRAGILCAPNDDQSMADGMERILRDDDAKRTYTDFARRVIETDHDLQYVAAMWKKAYESTLST